MTLCLSLIDLRPTLWKSVSIFKIKFVVSHVCTSTEWEDYWERDCPKSGNAKQRESSGNENAPSVTAVAVKLNNMILNFSQDLNVSIFRNRDKTERKKKENEKCERKTKSKKCFPIPGIEPGPRGWKPRILTTRPYGISHLWQLNIRYICESGLIVPSNALP